MSGNLKMKLPALVFFLLVFILPPIIPIHLPPLGTFWNEWVAGFLILLGWGVAWFEYSRKLMAPAAIIPWIGWGVAVLFSIWNAHYKIISPVYFAGIFWLLGALALFLVSSLKEYFGLQKLTTWIGFVLLASGFFQSTLGLARFYGLLEHISPWLSPVGGSRMPGLLNYPTITGFSLWLSIYAIVYLLYRKNISWVFAGACLLPMGIAIVAVGDRASVLYAAVLFFMVILLVCRSRLSDSYRNFDFSGRRALYCSSFIVLAILISVPLYGWISSAAGNFGKPKLDGKGVSRIENVYGRNGKLFGIRVTEFEKALFLAKSHFLFGIGPGNYPYQSYRLDRKIKGAVREGTVNTNSHNIFSMVLAEEGAVGILALLVGICFVGYWWWKLGLNVESLFIGSVLGAFFVFSNIEFPLWYLNFLVIFMAFIGMVSPNFAVRMDYPWVKPALAVMMICVGGGVALNLAFGFFQIENAQRDRVLKKEDYVTLASWRVDRLIEPYALLALLPYTVPEANDIRRQLRIKNKLISRFPMPKALLDRSILLLFEGKEGEACSNVREAANSYPNIVNQYNAEMEHYAKSDKDLPASPAVLKPCIEKGLAQWMDQRGN